MSAVLSRRALLAGLAAAFTSAASTTSDAKAAVESAENPELVRLADELPAVYEHYFNVWHADRAIRKKWHAVWPLAPDEISEIPITNATDAWDIPGQKERSFEGGYLWRKGERFPRIITSSYNIARQLQSAKRRLKRESCQAARDEVARLKRVYKLADEYENECVRIEAASHDEYTAGWKATKAASEAVCDLISKIMDQSDETMEGLLIKAEALETFGMMAKFDQHAAVFEPNKWHGQIAASILRHARGRG